MVRVHLVFPAVEGFVTEDDFGVIYLLWWGCSIDPPSDTIRYPTVHPKISLGVHRLCLWVTGRNVCPVLGVSRPACPAFADPEAFFAKLG